MVDCEDPKLSALLLIVGSLEVFRELPVIVVIGVYCLTSVSYEVVGCWVFGLEDSNAEALYS